MGKNSRIITGAADIKAPTNGGRGLNERYVVVSQRVSYLKGNHIMIVRHPQTPDLSRNVKRSEPGEFSSEGN